MSHSFRLHPLSGEVAGVFDLEVCGDEDFTVYRRIESNSVEEVTQQNVLTSSHLHDFHWMHKTRSFCGNENSFGLPRADTRRFSKFQCGVFLCETARECLAFDIGIDPQSQADSAKPP